MIIQHNMEAMIAGGCLNTASSKLQKSSERLSSGYKINRSADDAAHLAISEKMRYQIRGLDKAAINAEDGISLIQVADGALNETHAILHRMSELATQAANDTNTTADRDAIKDEIDNLAHEIDKIATTTQFNSQNILDGSFTHKNLQVGALEKQGVGLTIYKMDTHALGLSMDFTFTGANSPASIIANNGHGLGKIGATSPNHNAYDVEVSVGGKPAKYNSDNCLKVDTYANAGTTLQIVQNAVELVSEMRSRVGVIQNRLEHTAANVRNISENSSAAESLMRDTDMASEMVEYSKQSILSQVGQSLLTQANQSKQGVLNLLGGS